MLNPNLNWTELKLKQSFLIDGRIRVDNIFNLTMQKRSKIVV